MLLPRRHHTMRHACGVLSVIAGLYVLAGCVPSEASRYRGTMTRSVPPERRASADVSCGAGLKLFINAVQHVQQGIASGV